MKLYRKIAVHDHELIAGRERVLEHGRIHRVGPIDRGVVVRSASLFVLRDCPNPRVCRVREVKGPPMTRGPRRHKRVSRAHVGVGGIVGAKGIIHGGAGRGQRGEGSGVQAAGIEVELLSGRVRVAAVPSSVWQASNKKR